MKKVRKTLPKINLLTSNDQLRPVTLNVYCEKLSEGIQGNAGTYLVATNGHAITWFNLDEYVDQLMNLPDKFYIDPKQFKKLTNKKVEFIQYDESSKMLQTFDKVMNLIDAVPIIDADKVGVFYKWTEVIRGEKPGECINQIGINGQYLCALSEIFDYKAIKFTFDNNNKGIYLKQLTEDSSLSAFLMPVAIYEGQ